MSPLAVTECRLGLQHALREMRILKIVDPTNRCTMGHKYYRYMTEMYTLVKPQGQLIIRTPQQLNQLDRTEAIDADDDIATSDTPQFLPEINTNTSDLDLVVKNWAQAVGSFSTADQDAMAARLGEIFARYAADEDDEEVGGPTTDGQDETETETETETALP